MANINTDCDTLVCLSLSCGGTWASCIVFSVKEERCWGKTHQIINIHFYFLLTFQMPSKVTKHKNWRISATELVTEQLPFISNEGMWLSDSPGYMLQKLFWRAQWCQTLKQYYRLMDQLLQLRTLIIHVY